MLPRIHTLFTTGIDDAVAIDHAHIFFAQTHLYQQIDAGNTCRAGAGDDQFNVFNQFVDDSQTIVDCRCSDDCGAVLVVMKDWNFHSFAEFTFDFKAFGGLYVLEIDAAKRGF